MEAEKKFPLRLFEKKSAVVMEVRYIVRQDWADCVAFSGPTNGPIYTGDGSSVWDELGKSTVARLIIRLCINTGKQTDHLS